jgi:CubicO group peptidase (beta-lactamase class C family)
VRAAPTKSPGPLITAVVNGTGLRADAETPVPWWSYAKTVLASAALVLVAQGRISLDGPVHGEPFTLRQLLGHRAGLRCYGGLRAYHEALAAGEQPWDVKEMVRRVDTGTLAYEPGHGWGYSNVGYLTVRDLIETVADMTLGSALDWPAFAPLGSRVSPSRGNRPISTRPRGVTGDATTPAGFIVGYSSDRREPPRCSYTVCSPAISCRPTCWPQCWTPTRSWARYAGVCGRPPTMALD